jgi:cytosine/adenosine deaminase-related metal-dependent hydrolase
VRYWSPLEELYVNISNAGGFVNAHAHFDRAYTVNEKMMNLTKNHLFEKWELVDDIKRTRTVEEYSEGIMKAIDMQKFYGITSACTFIDVDPVVGHKALDGAISAKNACTGFGLKIACQTLKGILDREAHDLIEDRIGDIDIVGSLPGADKGREARHLDVVMEMAKFYGKMLHVHVDQLNDPEEKETELLARKTIQWGMEGKVVAVHSISLACHNKNYRNEVYKMAQDAGLMFVTCPSAWIDHPRTEKLMPFHNAVTPVDELIENDLIVALGSDNIHDIYKPYSNGDMYVELRFLLEACKIYDANILKKIAVDNGLLVSGIISN